MNKPSPTWKRESTLPLLVTPCLMFSLDRRKFGNLCWPAVKGRRGRGSHYKPHFSLPALLGQRCPAWPGGFSHPLLFPRPPTLYTIWNLVFPPLPNIKYCFQNKTTIPCWGRKMKPQHCMLSRLWWQVMPEGPMFSGAPLSGQLPLLWLITSAWKIGSLQEYLKHPVEFTGKQTKVGFI